MAEHARDLLFRVLRQRKHPFLPNYLFKYMSVDAPHFASAMSELVLNNSVFLSGRESFNDPFDTPTGFQCDVSDLVMYFSDRYKNDPPTLAEMLKRVATESDRMIQIQKETIRHTFNTCGIYCTSDVPDNPLMWAHYASSHRGVLLRLRYRHETASWPALPVEYVEQMRPFSMKDYMETHLYPLNTKGLAWRYEGEWRLVQTGRANTYFQLPPMALDAVLFGGRCPVEVHDFVRKLLEQRISDGFPAVQVFRSYIDEDAFKLRFFDEAQREIAPHIPPEILGYYVGN